MRFHLAYIASFLIVAAALLPTDVNAQSRWCFKTIDAKADSACASYGGEGECVAQQCTFQGVSLPNCTCNCSADESACRTKHRNASCENKVSCSLIINGQNLGGSFGGFQNAADCNSSQMGCGGRNDCQCSCTTTVDCSAIDNAGKTPTLSTKPDPLPPLINPLGKGVTDVRVIVSRFIRIITGISGSIALLMFVYGGFLWVTSAGNMDKVKKGKQVFVNASLGLIIIFSAYVAIATLFRVFSGASI